MTSKRALLNLNIGQLSMLDYALVKLKADAPNMAGIDELLESVREEVGKLRAKSLREQHTDILRKAAAKSPSVPDQLAKPECILGYTQDQVAQIMGVRLYEFRQWMCGQTEAICDAEAWDPETERNEPTGCGPHGIITYRQDVERFLLGLPVVD